MYGSLLLFEEEFVRVVSITFTSLILTELLMSFRQAHHVYTYVSCLGGIIMYGSLLLFEEEFVHVVSITFTSLILTELLMVSLTIRTWHWLMLFSQVLSLAFYIVALAVFRNYFGEAKTNLYLQSVLCKNNLCF